MSSTLRESGDYAQNLVKLKRLEDMMQLVRQDPWIESIRRLPVEEKLEIADSLLSGGSSALDENRLLRLIQVATLLTGEAEQEREVANRVTYCLVEVDKFLSYRKWDYRPLILLAGLAISWCLVTR